MKTSKSGTIYRKCSCGETAHDMQANPERDAEGKLIAWLYTWECRNCKSPAKNRDGSVKINRVER